jgi:hypothetical protein
VYHHIINRIKRPAQEICLENLGFIRRLCIHPIKTTRLGHGYLSAEENVVFAIIYTSVPHWNRRSGHFASNWSSIQVDGCDMNFLVSIGIDASVTGKVEVVSIREENSSLMGERIGFIFYSELHCWRCSNDCAKSWVVRLKTVFHIVGGLGIW